MGLAKRIDQNQTEIIETLRLLGCSVANTSRMGMGFPDIVIGLNGKNYLIEIKNGSKPPSAQALTSPEKRFHQFWRGQITVIKSTKEAIEFVNKERNYEPK